MTILVDSTKPIPKKLTLSKNVLAVGSNHLASYDCFEGPQSSASPMTASILLLSRKLNKLIRNL